MVEKTNKHIKDVLFTFEEFKDAINIIVDKFKDCKFDSIYVIPRGGYILGVILSHRLKIPLRIPYPNNYTKNTLICDDICDTGKTLKNISIENKKVVLVAKPNGIDKINNLFYVSKVDNNIWVKFWWEVL